LRSEGKREISLIFWVYVKNSYMKPIIMRKKFKVPGNPTNSQSEKSRKFAKRKKMIIKKDLAPFKSPGLLVFS